MKETAAVYPGTFDPITYGHIDIVKRAATLFERVIVAVAAHRGSGKKTVFSVDERITMAKQALSGFANVEVSGFDNLLVEFVRSCQAQNIVRGLRVVSDFEYEFQLAGTNRTLAPEIETVFLPTAAQYAFISSSLVREVAALGGAVEQFVPPVVRKALTNKFLQG